MKILFNTIFLLLSNPLISQVHFEWVKVYDNGFDTDVGFNVITDDSENVYVTGSVSGNFGSSRKDMIILKYSKTGQQIWKSIYKDTTTPYPNNWNSGSSIIFDDTGNVFVGGSRIWKYDGNGNLNWNVYTPFYKGFPKIFFDQNYGIISSTEFANSSFLIRKYSYTGDPLWERTYKPLGTIYAKWSDAIIDKNFNIITVGYMNKYGIGDLYDYVTVKYSGNGDLIWERRDGLYDDNSCYAVSVDDSNNIYITGMCNYSNSNILTIKYSSNGDTVWRKTFDGGGWDLANDIEVDSDGNVYVVGLSTGNGLIMIKYDIDGNLVWTRNKTGVDYTSYPFLKLDKEGNPYFAFSTQIPGAGSKYAVLKYNSGGDFQWLAEYSHNNSNSYYNQIRDMTIDNQNNIYVTGNGNGAGGGYNIVTVKWSQTITNINLISGLNPLEYFLYQNYPNPFNPVTQLKYSVPNFGFVSLKIFDILGNEIRTLVNENKSKGSYEVEFNGSSLSSGIYYYKLQSGNFTQTKKMLLLK